MEPERCVRCGEATVLGGSILGGPEAQEGGLFLPRESRSFRSKPGVPLRGGAHACVSCGHLWMSLDREVLMEFVRTHGTVLAVDHLDELLQGRMRGLPDTALAREVADKVAEVDAEARSGRTGAARYREVKGVTWDEAVHATRNWRDLKREEKLALFGWESKEKEPADEFF